MKKTVVFLIILGALLSSISTYCCHVYIHDAFYFFILSMSINVCIFFLIFVFFSYYQRKKTPIQESSFTNEVTKSQQERIEMMEFREQYRREFLGNVSHELKTPLFAIQGYVLTLIEGALNDKKVREKYLHRINKSVDRLVYIVKDLDLLAELERGNLQLNKETFNIVALAQEVFDLLEIKAQNAHVHVGFDTAYLEPIKVYADIEKIEQVLTNLVANAISHSQQDQSEVKISFQQNEKEVQIDVIDNGIGISSEHVDRIFERFYRVDSNRSRKYGGSGLGLSIVKNILLAHDQKIYVESEVGKGTRFYFNLPRPE